jgi:hypothetical protein
MMIKQLPKLPLASPTALSTRNDPAAHSCGSKLQRRSVDRRANTV